MSAPSNADRSRAEAPADQISGVVPSGTGDRYEQRSLLASADRKLTTMWDVRGINVATIQVNGRGTIAPQSEYEAYEGHHPEIDALADLPTMVTANDGQRVPQVELGNLIGQGGMGQVWGAVQTPLAREVAVKGLRPEAYSAALTEQLLQEARITGGLEHPNIVPIHALGRDEVGRPLIVMKRIEGVGWEELLMRQHRQGLAVVLENIRSHLNILLDVARAIHFAHARGIVHRDIKPGNIMIGSFGEVYVLDWGIAAGIGADHPHAPPASASRNILGSPAYMAPEMTTGENDSIDALTDVFLLGATLHDVLTGQPPHSGNNPRMTLTMAYACQPPEFDEAVPPALADICRTAMSREREDRYHSASAFATAIELYLSHESSTVLSEEASEKLEELRDVLSVSYPTDSEGQLALYNLFNEVRFSCINALRIWEDNTQARSHLQTALELMIHYELRNGSARSAAALIGELPVPRPQLSRRVDAKQREVHEHGRELTRLRNAADPTLQDRSRAMLSFVTAGCWALGHGLLAGVSYYTNYSVGHLEFGIFYSLFFLGTIILGAASRTFLARVASGLPTQLIVTLAHGAGTASWLVGWLLGLDMPQTFALMVFVSFTAWSAGAISVDRRFLAWSGALLLGLTALLIWPSLAMLWMGAAGMLASLLLAILRWRTRDAGASSPLSVMWARGADSASHYEEHSYQDELPSSRYDDQP